MIWGTEVSMAQTDINATVKQRALRAPPIDDGLGPPRRRSPSLTPAPPPACLRR